MTMHDDTGFDAASHEVAETYLKQVVSVDKNALRDINEIARYLFSSQIKCVSAKALIALGLANTSNVDVLVTALLQRKYITVSTKEGFYNIVPQGLVPSKSQRKSKLLTMEEKMERLHEPSNRDEFLYFARHSWLDVAWSLSRQGFNIFDRFPGTALVAPDRYPLPVTASKVLEILIDDGIVFAHSESYFRFTDKAKTILATKKCGSILPPADATPGGVTRSTGDKKHLKTLRRDLREIAVALNTWEFKRDDNRLAAVLVKLVRNSQLEIVRSVDGIFAACEELLASNNFVFRKGDAFVIKQDDEELRARMLAANAVTHSPTQRLIVPLVAQAPVARPPSRDERRRGQQFVPFPRVSTPAELPKPQPVVKPVPVPAKIVVPVVETVPVAAPVVTPSPAPAPVAAADVVPTPAPVLAAGAAPLAVEVSFNTFDQAVQSGDLAVGGEVAVPPASITISKTDLVPDDSPVSFTDAKLVAVPIQSKWVSYVKTQYNKTTWTRIHLIIGLTKASQYMTPDLIAILVNEFGFSSAGAYQVIYECTKINGLATSRRIKTTGGKLVAWQKDKIVDYESFLRQLIGGFAASLLTEFSEASQPESVPIPVVVVSAEPVLVTRQDTAPVSAPEQSSVKVPVRAEVVYAKGVQPIDTEFVQFVIANYDHTKWSHHDFFYVVTRGMPYESLDLVNVVSQFTDHIRHCVTERIFTSTSRGLSKAVRHGENRRSGKTIYWCENRISRDTKDLLQQVQGRYIKQAKGEAQKPDVTPLSPSASAVPVPASQVSPELVVHVLKLNDHMNTKEDLAKALTEIDRLNKSLDEATSFFAAEQAAHRVTTGRLTIEEAAHKATLTQLDELVGALSILQKFMKTIKK